MLPDRVSNPGPLTYESGALPIALRGPAIIMTLFEKKKINKICRTLRAQILRDPTDVFVINDQ